MTGDLLSIFRPSHIISVLLRISEERCTIPVSIFFRELAYRTISSSISAFYDLPAPGRAALPFYMTSSCSRAAVDDELGVEISPKSGIMDRGQLTRDQLPGFSFDC